MLTSCLAISVVPSVDTTLLPFTLMSLPACTYVVLPENVVPCVVVSDSVLRVVIVFFENQLLLPLNWCASSTSRVVCAAPRLTLLPAVATSAPCSLVTEAPRAFRSLPAESRKSPVVWIDEPTSCRVPSLRQLLLSHLMDCEFDVSTVFKLRSRAAATTVWPPVLALPICAPAKFRSRPADATSVPPDGAVTYRPAMRLTLVRLPCALLLLRVVLATFRSRPAIALRLLLASMMPPRLSRSVRARTATSPPVMRPPRFFTFSAVIDTTSRPAMLPWFTMSPDTFRLTLCPAISAPEPSRSPGFTCTYTCGTSARVVWPLGSVTSCSTSQTMSLVSCAICAAVSATPGRRPHALA